MKRRRGVTLIELLVVVAIIAILLTVVVAVGTSIRASSHITTTKAYLLALQQGSELLWEEFPDESRRPNFSGNSKAAKVVAKVPSRGVDYYDSWGNAVRYVPPHVNYKTMPDGTKVPESEVIHGYWQSAGPDSVFDTSDDLYSTDAH